MDYIRHIQQGVLKIDKDGQFGSPNTVITVFRTVQINDRDSSILNLQVISSDT